MFCYLGFVFAVSEVRFAALALGLFLFGLAAELSGCPEWLWVSAYLACYLAGGWEPAIAGVRALAGRTLDVDLLMVLAAIGAAAIGQFMDGALLIVIFASSGALEALATRRTEESVRGLLRFAPETASRVTADGEQTVAVAELAVGDEVLVRPGERIAADGIVLHGESEVDKASITGEPLPVPTFTGDEVFAGTGNGTGALRIRVGRTAEHSVLARIAESVREASATKAGTQLFVERVERWYSLGMVAATVLLFAIPLALGTPFREALLRAMTFMIVASPCALVLATMPPLLAAIATASRNGVLVKSAVALERLARTTRFAFDKTGTLTKGAPVLAEIHTADRAEEDVLALAAAVEYPSEHPLAGAILDAARERELSIAPVGGFSARPGRGVRGRVDGTEIEVGVPSGQSTMDDVLAAVRARGRTAVLVSEAGKAIGVLGIADRTRAGAVAAVAGCVRLTGTGAVLVTGDHSVAAQAIADEVGIRTVHAGLLPEQKRELIAGYESEGARMAVVGDGVNDAPALAAAGTGLAMGGAGADLSLGAADVVLVRDELTAVPTVLALARRAERVVVANLVIAAAFILGLVVWDLAGVLPLPLGVAGHEGSTVLVGLNGLRLLGSRAWRRARDRAGAG
ncbi:heavy metal translocating P-type ATPase [Sciscionella sediminilitoris]|uniref:heavy metal translocating P-type ATPase n=1 Tax=Sciscionella sediminilitoris TaxID=1445613 RepID=UPI00055AB0C5|nr:heavy metal translocating P-type ATPase [Sciscionella sp. SE31]